MITGSTDIGDGKQTVTVDHDPESTNTDVPKGSVIIWDEKHYLKIDDGATTNVIPVIPNDIESLLTVKTSSQSGTTVLNHNVFNMTATGTSSISWQGHVPSAWDSSKDPQIRVVGFTNGADTSKNYVFEFGIESTNPNGGIIDGVDDLTVSYVQAAEDAADATVHGTKQTLNRATLDLANKKHLSIFCRRLGSDASDDRANQFRLLHVTMFWPRKSFGVTL